LRKATIAVTELRSDDPEHGMSGSIAREDAHIVALQLKDYPLHEHWEDGRQVSLSTYRAGEVTIYDLKRDPTFMVNAPFHSLHFYLPRAALDAIAEEASAPRIQELRYRPGGSVEDSTIRNVGLSLLAAFGRPEEVNRVFMDHVTLAVAAHIAQTYGGLQTRVVPRQGGLAPWQEKRAKELLASDLRGGVSLQEIAAACSLSAGHFARAFRRSTGLPPHAWLLQLRVDTAKAMLRTAKLPIGEVALACGFADQSHFTRVFTRSVGASPAAWRRGAWEPS
jgi:AraC-like DNA-binding protein